MIHRYTRPRMGKIWEDQNKYQRWLDVELAVVETLADEGIIPKDAAAEIKARASFSVDRINQIEAEVKHDVIAFTTSVAQYVGPASRYFHFGLTSSDVVDSAMALQVADASAVILADLQRLLDGSRLPGCAHQRPGCPQGRVLNLDTPMRQDRPQLVFVRNNLDFWHQAEASLTKS